MPSSGRRSCKPRAAGCRQLLLLCLINTPPLPPPPPGDEAEDEDAEAAEAAAQLKIKSAHDALEDERLAKEPAVEVDLQR